MPRTLQQGSTGPDVEELETKLVENGYFVGTVDETFDVQTDAAIRYYQSLNGLTVDGIVGPQTRASLGLEGGGGGGGGGGEDYGIRITNMTADKDGVTYTAQAHGSRGGAGLDAVAWATPDGQSDVVQLLFEIGPTGSYDRQASTPARVREWWDAAAGHGFSVTVATNVGPEGGESDMATSQVAGWSGGV
ncbi:MAG: N-acetylmuramoyl-L-alanine amidase [Acidimicrobiaceae bacterium]|nr:N-acetylmuramoyl-L-alanine amidase [Acidimicrobiaceae bacterium]